VGILDRLRGTGPDTPQPAKTVLAAAMPLNGPQVRQISRTQKQSTTEQWQNDAAYYFDVIGEVRAPMVWIANAVSQADLYASELDPDTGKPTGPTDNATANAAAMQVLGGPSKRSGLLRSAALCWQCVGEYWVIVRPRGQGKPDDWFVLSGQKVRAKGAAWVYCDPMTGAETALDANSLLVRSWSPHPFDQAKPDSAMRPALVECREVEKATQNLAARLDSRIAMNGLAALAEEVDFPHGDHDTSAASLADTLLLAAETGIRDPGQAAAQVPVLFTAPAEIIANGGAFAHYDLSTTLDGQVIELRQDALKRLAAALDMPRDVAEGTQGEANHWTAWQVEESTYKIFIEPLLKAIGDVLTEYWYRPALITMGMSADQAATYELAWDTTAIVARPDDSETLESLYDKILISDEYFLTENGVSIDAMPAPEERTRRLLEKLVSVAPTLLADPAVAEAMGLGITPAPVAAGVDATVTPAGELEAPEPAPAPNALPGTQTDRPDDSVPDGLIAAAELIVYDALSRAGGRLLTNQNRGQFKSTSKEELYRQIPYERTPDRVHALMEGSFQFTDKAGEALGVDGERLHSAVSSYVYGVLRARAAYNRRELTWALRELM